MRLYFAGSYGRRAEIAAYRDQIRREVPWVTVTSRWLDEHGGAQLEPCTPDRLAEHTAAWWEFAQEDIADLYQADGIVSFTGAGATGGRHVEHGMALTRSYAGKFRLIIVGPRENVFHCHPDTEVYATWADFLQHEAEGAIAVRELDGSGEMWTEVGD